MSSSAGRTRRPPSSRAASRRRTRVVTTGFSRISDGTKVNASLPNTRPTPSSADARRSAAAPRPRPAARGSCGDPSRDFARMSISGALHPAAGRYVVAAWRRGAALRDTGLFAVARLGAAAGGFPDDPRHDPVAGRQSRHGGFDPHRAAGAPVRPDPLDVDHVVGLVLRARARSPCNSISTATSTRPRRTCSRRSTRQVRRCPRRCPIRRPIRR